MPLGALLSFCPGHKNDTLTHIELYQTVHMLTVPWQWLVFFYVQILYLPITPHIYILSNAALKSGTFTIGVVPCSFPV